MGRTKKFRGHRTHGRGRKAGRGAGLRGGRGNAGLHKHKFMSVIKYDPDHFGDYGFKRHPSLIKRKTTINLSEVETSLERFVEIGAAEMKGKTYHIDLGKCGIDKLLGGGKVSKPLKIVVNEWTEKAEKKILDAGGEITKPEDLE